MPRFSTCLFDIMEKLTSKICVFIQLIYSIAGHPVQSKVSIASAAWIVNGFVTP